MLVRADGAPGRGRSPTRPPRSVADSPRSRSAQHRRHQPPVTCPGYCPRAAISVRALPSPARPPPTPRPLMMTMAGAGGVSFAAVEWRCSTQAEGSALRIP